MLFPWTLSVPTLNLAQPAWSPCILSCIAPSPADDEWSAVVVLPDALGLLVAVGGGLADAAQARQGDVVVPGSALPLLTWNMGREKDARW